MISQWDSCSSKRPPSPASPALQCPVPNDVLLSVPAGDHRDHKARAPFCKWQPQYIGNISIYKIMAYIWLMSLYTKDIYVYIIYIYIYNMCVSDAHPSTGSRVFLWPKKTGYTAWSSRSWCTSLSCKKSVTYLGTSPINGHDSGTNWLEVPIPYIIDLHKAYVREYPF